MSLRRIKTLRPKIYLQKPRTTFPNLNFNLNLNQTKSLNLVMTASSSLNIIKTLKNTYQPNIN